MFRSYKNTRIYKNFEIVIKLNIIGLILALRDVTVSENYSTTEREERLLAAKKLIDSDLTEFALKEILKAYSDILDETEIMQAKSLLDELQTSQNNDTQNTSKQ